MNQVLLVVLSLSLSGSVLALGLLLLRPLVRQRLSQTWQYYVWLVVILRFLLPISPDISLVGQVVQFLPSRELSSVAEAVPEVDRWRQPEQLPSQVPAYDSQPTAQADSDAGASLPVAATSARWGEIRNSVWMVWAAGALMLFAYKVVSYNGFLRFVRGRAQKVTDRRLLELYRQELMAAKVRKLPLRVSDRVASPMLIGLFRPALVIPVLDTGDEEWRHIFRHELTHYKRLDSLYKWLVQITKCLHWFNPLVHSIGKQIDQCCELSCDEANIRRLDADGRESYGDALMASLTSQENYSSFVVAVTMSENAKLVKERLELIVNYRKKTGVALCGSLFFTLLLLCGFTLTGAYTTPMSNTGNHPETGRLSSAAQPAQEMDPRLTLVEKEYTVAELQALNVSGLIVEALAENIEVTRGGEVLKLSYYQLSDEEYLIATQPDKGSTVNELTLRRSAPVGWDEPQRTIFITVPEYAVLEEVISLATDSGSIRLNHCEAEYLGVSTQSGDVFIHNGSVSQLLTVETASGNALISGAILPVRGTGIVGTELCTETGTIMFQPAESAWDYRYNLNTGADARIFVNGKQYQGGGGNINHFSRSRVYFETANGSLIVQDFQMGRLSLEDVLR